MFARVVDLQLQVAALAVDLGEIGKSANSDLRNPSRVSRDYLNDEEAFSERLALFRAMSGFVLRYRAIWDKIMGTHVLILDPEGYDRFKSTRSRRRAFVRFMAKRGSSLSTVADDLAEVISEFDRKFRTEEAHGTGASSRLAFEPFRDGHPVEDLFWAWNELNRHLLALAEIFRRGADRKDGVGLTRPAG